MSAITSIQTDSRARNEIARAMLSTMSIGDPTDSMVASTAGMISRLLDELSVNPTLDDYAGGITSCADDVAADWTLRDVAGSVDFLSYESELAEPSASISERVGIMAFKILSYVAHQVVNDYAPDPMDVPWSKIPKVSHGDVLVARSREDGPVYVSVRVETRDDRVRLSITGHTACSAGQCVDILRSEVEPAPGLTVDDLRELADVWDRWHLNYMQTGCEHQRKIAGKMGKHTGEVFTTANASREVDAAGIARLADRYDRKTDGKQASRARVVCQVCSHSYGSAWLYEEVPASVLAFLARFTTTYDDQAREILRRNNVTEPGGEWSTYDLARALDPEARDPRHMHDTGADTRPSDAFYGIARAAIGRIDPPARYVGGTSKYLYHITDERKTS